MSTLLVATIVATIGLLSVGFIALVVHLDLSVQRELDRDHDTSWTTLV